MKGMLVLENGAVFCGWGRGYHGYAVGEVVFNTSMTGFQEILTDPSYCGQIINMTYPLIGNYGVNSQYNESRQSYARGFIVRQLCDTPSNWRCEQPLDDFLAAQRVVCLEKVDNRKLTKLIRTAGTMKGIIAHGDYSEQQLMEILAAYDFNTDCSCVKTVTTQKAYTMGEGEFHVVVMDFGVKLNILRSLVHYGCRLTVVPATASADDILALNPDGIFLSNGPGDPADVDYVITHLQQLMRQKPIFGICLGHQLLALAAGAKTYKLKFGHRGANHPVKELQSGKVYITSQNHGYAVDADTLAGTGFRVSHVGLNDNTVEGIVHQQLPVFSVQYHPEAAPGPQDSQYLFERFIGLMRGVKSCA